MLIKRQPTSSEKAMKFEFNTKGSKFLVKNFTDGDIYVGLGESTEKETMILIPAATSQICMIQELGTPWSQTDVVTIIPTATSEKGVEVQCLKW